MRLIHRVPFSSQEVESFRQLIFNNLTHGLKYVLDSMEDMGLEVSPDNGEHIELIESASDLRDGEVFPEEFFEPLKLLWNDKGVQQAWDRGNEAALPEKYNFLFFLGRSSLRRLFKSGLFLLRSRSTISARIRSHRAGHRALSCTDNRHHRDTFPTPRA